MQDRIFDVRGVAGGIGSKSRSAESIEAINRNTLDYGRIPTPDIAELQIAKGFAPALE
ncbi:MAG: hypothetical protein KDA46_03820 [Parvularculaceae bacterium]|nr:hypothetical protein [Parvularculaceae bacterium]